MADKIDLTVVVRNFVTTKVLEAIDEIDLDDIEEEAEEEGLNPREIKGRIKDGTVKELIDNIREEIKEVLVS